MFNMEYDINFLYFKKFNITNVINYEKGAEIS